MLVFELCALECDKIAYLCDFQGQITKKYCHLQQNILQDCEGTYIL